VAYDPNEHPIHQPRRRDRAVEEEAWIRAYLQRAAWGVLATVYDGQPFLNSNLFVYDPAQHVIYLHTARLGRTRSNIETSPQVCFTVGEMGRLLPADTALEFSVEYSSVVVFGKARVVEDEAEARRALQLLLDKYFPHLRPERDYRPIQPEEMKRTSVYRIDIERWSAKRKAVEDDFPGAFLYGQNPEVTAVQRTGEE
jgi:nitroimidazol reductase NimA-like FMN-containing flavoprotein (pyridoxamine 5'-phosphate oxidase superfamily)